MYRQFDNSTRTPYYSLCQRDRDWDTLATTFLLNFYACWRCTIARSIETKRFSEPSRGELNTELGCCEEGRAASPRPSLIQTDCIKYWIGRRSDVMQILQGEHTGAAFKTSGGNETVHRRRCRVPSDCLSTYASLHARSGISDRADMCLQYTDFNVHPRSESSITGSFLDHRLATSHLKPSLAYLKVTLLFIFQRGYPS